MPPKKARVSAKKVSKKTPKVSARKNRRASVAKTKPKKLLRPKTKLTKPKSKLKPKLKKRPAKFPRVERSEHNPVIRPDSGRSWESKATFNPAALYEDGRVHLLYRAIGDHDISVLGYAASSDGFQIDERAGEPAFAPNKKGDIERDPKAEHPAVAYSSGGGWNGGCEDPRLATIDGVVYLIYTAFDGWGSIRIALSSIDLDDFLAKRWRWTRPVLISPPGEIHKNWVMFPEKINGKYAILHSVSPEILIDYVGSFDEFGEGKRTIQSHYDKSAQKGRWDSLIRGAGPPPLKTKHGWLLLYHAMDVRDPNRYKLGAMILDEKDPTKVLYRSKYPILEPDECYENEGFKSGVIYSCGAVVADGQLLIYYGGADKVTCVAAADIDAFIDELKATGLPKVKKVSRISSRGGKNAGR